MTATLSVTESNRAEWLALRESAIGSSEAAAAIGVSPYETPLGLYLRKTGQAEPVEETEPMRWGSRLEPLIADAYGEVTGYGFSASQLFLRSAEHPFMVATLDRLRTDGRVVELKTVGARQAGEWGEAGTGDVPRWYACQVLHQLAVADADEADIAALICGQELRVYHLERDDRVLAEIVEREAEFWGRVQRREPPPVDPARDARLMARLFPEAVGEIEFDDEASSWVREWELFGAESRLADKGRDRLKVQILERMGSAASARLGDGRVLTRKVIHVAEACVTRKAYDRIDLRLKGE